MYIKTHIYIHIKRVILLEFISQLPVKRFKVINSIFTLLCLGDLELMVRMDQLVVKEPDMCKCMCLVSGFVIR